MKNPIADPGRIVWMSNWDQDYVDMEVPGHITVLAFIFPFPFFLRVR